MKKNLIPFTKAFICILLFMALPAIGADAFNISSYNIDMTIYEDNSYAIVETIGVEFSQDRYGIIRSIPLRTNRNKRALLSDIDVLDHKFSTEKVSNNMEIKIGDPNRYASQQEKYTIGYIYTIGDDYLDDRDELYWNLIGNEWDTTIENVTFNINMPKDFSPDRLYFTHGKKGSTKHDGVDWSIEGNTIQGRMNVSLRPNDSLTISLPLPEGYFSQAQRINNQEMPYGWLVSIASLVTGLALWLLMGWKKRIFPSVEFYPPQGLTSADAGFLIDGRVNSFDITSLIIYWAGKGYLSIREEDEKKFFGSKKSFILRRLKDLSPTSQDYEREMFDGLFSMGDGNEVSRDQLENRFYSLGERIKKQIRASFEASDETRIFSKTNVQCRIFLLFIGVISTLPYSYLVMKESGNIGGWSNFFKAIIMSLAIMLVIYFLVYTLMALKGMKKRDILKQLFFMIFISSVICGIFIYSLSLTGNLLRGLFSIGGTLVLGILANLCLRRTETGSWYLEKLLGFREFIKAAELDRIKILADENPDYFYHVLPYAMVLGLTDKWARKFDSIMKEPPSWYYSTSIKDRFSLANFATGLDNDLKGFSSQVASKHASRDSSPDGGSSGGGSGGGGGRSW